MFFPVELVSAISLHQHLPMESLQNNPCGIAHRILSWCQFACRHSGSSRGGNDLRYFADATAPARDNSAPVAAIFKVKISSES
jgi:hypothetical protein